MYADKERKDDFNWFLNQYEKIYKKYGECYVAIKNKKIIGVYKSTVEGISDIKEPLGSYIIQHCNGNESGYTNYIASMNFISQAAV